jgi:HPt (histidine-containing phosphotransfer) domain-containing protein
MDQPIDFNNLRLITGGDAEMESELFQVFLESADQCMKDIRAAMTTQDNEGWKVHTHAFKGICVNLGAMPLGALCSKAQHEHLAPSAEKQVMLSAMESELKRVQEALKAC